MPGKPVSLRVKNIARGQSASGGTTQGFAVTFDNGEESELSAEMRLGQLLQISNSATG
jgi:hypothetical protein